MTPCRPPRVLAQSRRVPIIAVAALGLAVGCDSSSGPDHGPPANFLKHAGDAQTATVATVLPNELALRITDSEGRPVPGIEVTFEIASGGGAIVDGDAETDDDGVATAGAWTIGTGAGANTVTASTEDIVRATFTATGVAGAPAALVKVLGDNQTATTFGFVAVAPSVRLRDAHNNPVASVGVTFVASTGGIVTGGTTTTDAAGIATVGSWKLGNGTNVLTASSANVANVTFAATTLGCEPVGTIALGQPVTGALEFTDCRYPGGEYADWLTFVVAAQQAVQVDVTSAAFDAFAEAYSGVLPVALGDNISDTDMNARTRVIMAPGTYRVAASSSPPGVFGAYTISVVTAPEDVPGCDLAFLTPGIATPQSLASTDCQAPSGQIFYTDPFAILMRSGREYTIRNSSTAFDSWLELFTAGGTFLVGNNDAIGTDAQIVFRPAVTNFYVIEASSNLVTTSGAYTLSIEERVVSGGAQISADVRRGPPVAASHGRAGPTLRDIRPR